MGGEGVSSERAVTGATYVTAGGGAAAPGTSADSTAGGAALGGASVGTALAVSEGWGAALAVMVVATGPAGSGGNAAATGGEVISTGSGSETRGSCGRKTTAPTTAPPMATARRPPTSATMVPVGPLARTGGRAGGGAGAMTGVEKGRVAITGGGAIATGTSIAACGVGESASVRSSKPGNSGA